MRKEVVERENVGNDLIAVVMRNLVFESRVWKQGGTLRCHLLFD